MIWIGTSGFQYPEWKGSFYPEIFSPAKMLPYYAERFNTTEINYSFYRIPAPKSITNWAAATPSQFRFSFKAPKEMTHILKLRDTGEVLNRFWKVIGAMETKLGVVLFQLPPYFKRDLPLLKDFMLGWPNGLRGAFEFRHVSWFTDETFQALKSGNAALCVAESDDLATPTITTAATGYFRLRKTNYSKNEIRRWAEIIVEQQSQVADTFVYLKHEDTASGPRFAKELIDVIKGIRGSLGFGFD